MLLKQPERVGVALLRGRVDGEELHDPIGPPATRHTEMAPAVRLGGEMTAVEAVAEEVDELAATRALAFSALEVGQEHAFNVGAANCAPSDTS